MTVTANIVVEWLDKGGWVMWPVIATFFLAICVILDRIVWWLRYRESLHRKTRDEVREALLDGDFESAWNLSRNSPDPYLTNLRHGFAHAHTSMLAAMQLHATQFVEKSEARMWVLSTLITLAPLLGLFGTVSGLMGSFAALGHDQLAVSKITGGIGEALIATACGIAIAVLCLLPYNFFRKRVASLRRSLERWIQLTGLPVNSTAGRARLRSFVASLKSH